MARFRDDTDFPDLELRRRREFQSGEASSLASRNRAAVGEPRPPPFKRNATPTDVANKVVSRGIVDLVRSPKGVTTARNAPIAAKVAQRMPADIRLLSLAKAAQARQRALDKRARLVQASAADRRKYDPTRALFPSVRTVYGTAARTFIDPSFRRAFYRAHAVVPCVQRQIRREVMFAKKKAGRGYSTAKRRTFLSNIGC